jgi:serine/threonine-protein kinase HipA
MSHKKLKEIELLFETLKVLTISEILESTTIPRATLKRYLNRLIEESKIEAHGKGRGRYYQLKNKIEDNRVVVLKSGSLVGYLSYQGGRYSFEYDRSYKGKKLDGLSGEETFYSTTIFPIFENLIPESDRRDSYLAENKNLVEILLELENTHGDFDFVTVDKIYTHRDDYTHRKSWISVKKSILEEQIFPNILDMRIDIDRAILEAKGKHSSLSGYQNKIDVNVDFKAKKIAQSSGALYLLKPYTIESAIYDFKDKNQTHLPYLGLNEHLFMSFAKNAYGFDVPWSGVVAGERDFHYVVKRYDRYEGYKYEQRDFAQIMSVKSDQKYFTTSERLFDAIADVVKPKEERLQFLEFYLFSFVIEHADLHLKNISIINIGRDKYRLSPLYDLISNGLYRGDSDELGLPLGGKKHNIAIEDFYNLAERIGISRLQTKKSANKIVDIFIKEFPSYIALSSKIELFDGLKIQKNRYSFSDFTSSLEKFYQRRVKRLKIFLIEDKNAI